MQKTPGAKIRYGKTNGMIRDGCVLRRLAPIASFSSPPPRRRLHPRSNPNATNNDATHGNRDLAVKVRESSLRDRSDLMWNRRRQHASRLGKRYCRIGFAERCILSMDEGSIHCDKPSNHSMRVHTVHTHRHANLSGFGFNSLKGNADIGHEQAGENTKNRVIHTLPSVHLL